MKLLFCVLLLFVAWQVPASNRPTPHPSKFIFIDLKKQQLYAFQDEHLVYCFHCSTGRRGKRTPTGTFKVTKKQSEGYALKKYGGKKLPYVLGVNGHILIHGFGSVPNRPASHGCIRLKVTNARRLYNWARIGTPVIVSKTGSNCLQ